MVHILPCSAAERHRSCDTYSCISPEHEGPHRQVRPFVVVLTMSLWLIGSEAGYRQERVEGTHLKAFGV